MRCVQDELFDRLHRPTPTGHPALLRSTHAGGAEALLAVRGQDCTQVFLENHPFTNPVEMLAQYEVGASVDVISAADT